MRIKIITLLLVIWLSGCTLEKTGQEIATKTEQGTQTNVVITENTFQQCETLLSRIETEKCYWDIYWKSYNEHFYLNDAPDHAPDEAYRPKLSAEDFINEFSQCPNDFCREFIFAELVTLDKTMITEEICNALPKQSSFSAILENGWYNHYAEISSDGGETDKRIYLEPVPQIHCIYDVLSKKEIAPEEISRSETSESKSINNVLEGREYAFDSCGKIDKYLSLPFFDAFIQQLTSQKQSDDSNYFTTTSISELCFSQEENVLIGIVEGDYCRLGAVFKYDVDLEKLQLADVDLSNRKACPGAISEFGKRDGKYIEIPGGGGDAGYFFNITYHYYYDSNWLTIGKICDNYIGTEDVESGNEATNCTDFSL